MATEIGTPFADIFLGTNASDTFLGRGGDDTFFAAANDRGLDFFAGGRGNDTYAIGSNAYIDGLTPNLGLDSFATIFAGRGDTIAVSNPDNYIVETVGRLKLVKEIASETSQIIGGDLVAVVRGGWDGTLATIV